MPSTTIAPEVDCDSSPANSEFFVEVIAWLEIALAVVILYDAWRHGSFKGGFKLFAFRLFAALLVFEAVANQDSPLLLPYLVVKVLDALNLLEYMGSLVNESARFENLDVKQALLKCWKNVAAGSVLLTVTVGFGRVVYVTSECM